MLLIFIVNMLGLFLSKTKKILKLVTLCKKIYTNPIISQTKYGLIKVVNFTIDQLKSWLEDNCIKLYLTYNE